MDVDPRGMNNHHVRKQPPQPSITTKLANYFRWRMAMNTPGTRVWLVQRPSHRQISSPEISRHLRRLATRRAHRASVAASASSGPAISGMATTRSGNSVPYSNHSPPASSSNIPFFLQFYHPSSHVPDKKGRTLPALLGASDSYLERSHDYIQLLFPLPESSPFNPYAPVITAEICHAFRNDAILRRELQRAFERMLRFYDLEPSHSTTTELSPSETGTETKTKGLEPYTIRPSPSFNPSTSPITTRMNHNHLRLTRILRSLRVLGLGPSAEALYRCLTTDLNGIEAGLCPGRIGRKTLMYWERAARRDVAVAPDQDHDFEDKGDGGGNWLRELRDRGDVGGKAMDDYEAWGSVWSGKVGGAVWREKEQG